MSNSETKVTPGSFEQWLNDAKADESFSFLWEQVRVLQTELSELRAKNEEQKKTIAQLNMQLTNITSGLVAHKHAAQTGESTIPAGMVLRVDQ